VEELRATLEAELAQTAMLLDLADALRGAAPAVALMCDSLDLPFEPATFLVTFTAMACARADVDGVAALRDLHADGLLETLVDQLGA
jgi:hypothetical protein